MAFVRKFRTEPEFYPSQIYFVDKVDRETLETAKIFGLPIIEPEANNNVKLTRAVAHTIYVFTDFENNKIFRLIERSPHTWILGPTALREIACNPDLEIRSKPTYCTFMYGFVFYINCPEDFPLMERMVQLLKWMGGLFCTEPNFNTTHMVTTSTRALGYTYCYTFNVPILSPAWVEHCWLQRDMPYFDVKSVMDSFKVSAFLGLYITFIGFSSEELPIYEKFARENEAAVVTVDDPRCSHVVISHDIERHVNINDVPSHIPYVVKQEWFMSSIKQKQRVYEDDHRCFSTKEIKKSLWAIMDSEETNSSRRKSSAFKASLNDEDKVLVESTKKESQDLNRKYAFEDLILKETNYLHCLRQLLDIQNNAADVSQPGGAILNRAETKIIFGNLDRLVEIHSELVNNFIDIQKNWNNNAITVQKMIDFKDELLKEYVMYTNNYKESKKRFVVCEAEKKRFRKLLETSMKTAKREHPKDIFIRPIQRLCSVILQLREINKNTREDNPDKQVLNEAIAVVNDVLKKIDNQQEQVEKLIRLFDIHRLIKDCPPDLITSHRNFIIQFSAQEVVSNQNVVGAQIMFFLFNDILEITKIRFKGQAVLNNYNTYEKEFFLKEKLYKHITTLPLSVISNVILFEGKDEDDQNIFGFNVKDIKEERTTGMSIHCFHYLDDNRTQLHELLLLIAKQLALEDSSKSPEDYILGPMPTSRFSLVPITLKPQGKLVTSAFDKMCVLLKKTHNKPNIALRKSLSCGDLINP